MTDCFINISVKTYNPVHTEERKFNSIDEAIRFLEAYKMVIVQSVMELVRKEYE